MCLGFSLSGCLLQNHDAAGEGSNSPAPAASCWIACHPSSHVLSQATRNTYCHMTASLKLFLPQRFCLLLSSYGNCISPSCSSDPTALSTFYDHYFLNSGHDNENIIKGRWNVSLISVFLMSTSDLHKFWYINI